MRGRAGHQDRRPGTLHSERVLPRRRTPHYTRAARLSPSSSATAQPAAFITQRGPYADLTSVLNGADHLTEPRDLYVAFADNLYPGGNPLATLRETPSGHPAVLARAYRPELAASRGVIAAARHGGQFLMHDLAEKPSPSTARSLEQRYGAGNLLLLEGRAPVWQFVGHRHRSRGPQPVVLLPAHRRLRLALSGSPQRVLLIC